MKEITKLDKVNIYSSCILSSDDYYSLSLLYQPLINSDALGLYLTLNSLIERNNLKSETFFHYNLLDVLGLSFESFLQVRLKLEAIGLLETFFKEGEYIYLLKQPLTPSQFLKDSTFGLYLYSKIGQVMYDSIINHFRIESINKNEYDNITASFDDVFSSEIPDLKTIDNDEMILGRKPNSSVSIKHYEFNFNSFLELIDDSNVEGEINDSFKKSVVDTAYIYGFDEGDMASLYKQSIGKNGYFDAKLLRNKANVLFKYKTNSEAPTLGVKPLSINNELLDEICNVSIESLLNFYWPNYPKTYLLTVDEIYRTIDLPRDVLTLMIFFILKQKQGELPVVSYFKSVADTWKSNGIVSKEQAFVYITSPRNLSETPKNTYKRKPGKVKTTEWAEEKKKNIKEGFETL